MRLVMMAAITLLIGNYAQAQLGGQGAIQGTVTDPTGAVVPNATVTANAIDTGVKTTRTTTGSGYYVISPLQREDTQSLSKRKGSGSPVRKTSHWTLCNHLAST